MGEVEGVKNLLQNVDCCKLLLNIIIIWEISSNEGLISIKHQIVKTLYSKIVNLIVYKFPLIIF